MAVMAAPSRRRLSDVSIRCPNCETSEGVEGVRDLTMDLIARMDELSWLFRTDVHRVLYCMEHSGNSAPEICPVCAVARFQDRQKVISK